MEPIDRMHVTGKHMPIRMRFGFVLQGEWPQQQRLRHHANVQRSRRIPGALVMVAANQRHGQLGVACSPVSQGFQRGARMGARTVKKVPEENQLAAGQGGQ
ncbi:hypothetical protein D9M71_675800 [compost metagenome]